MMERWSDTWPGSSRAMRMTGHWVDPRQLWVWENEAENSGVLGLERVDRSTEAGRFWVPGTLHGHRAPNQIPRGFHEKKSLFGVKLLQCDYSRSLSWLTHDTNLPQNHSLWPHSLNDQKAVSVSIKTMGLGRQSYGEVLTERGQGPALESPEPTEN